MIESVPVTLTVERSVSPGARTLIWDEFFGSRARGIDWATHLPWATPGHVLCASAATATGVVAALLVRRVPGTDTAMLGYVCVRPDYRGRKLSSTLIGLLASTLASSELRQMVLWTGKPRVYENSGFTIVAQEQRLTLKLRPSPSAVAIRLTPWPGVNDGGIGLPPFAAAGWRADGDDAQVVFVDTPTGATLLGMHGTPGSVVQTMMAARPGTWSTTVDAQDAFASYVAAHDLVIERAEGPVTMYRPLIGRDILPAKLPLTIRI